MRNMILVGVLSVLATGFAWGDQPVAGKQVEQVLKVEGKSIPYLLWLPKDYDTKTGKFPLMLFLHGRGESQGPLASVKKWGPPRRLEHGEALPYVVASPQCPAAESWNQAGQQALLLALIDNLVKEYKVDPERIYLTGLSMGGYGSWRLAADHPELFAAVAPVCGGGKPEDANKLKDLPIWVWHGADDSIVALRESTQMVDAIKQAGGTKIRFTTLEHIGHNSWEAAYASPELYSWFDKQSRKSQIK